MKVILLMDVAKIGRRFEIKEVPDGYALNKLIPKNMAQFATPENIKRIETTASKQKEHRAHDASVFTEVLEALKGILIPLEVEANAEGRMFQSLKAENVASAINAVLGNKVTAEQIQMHTPIKSLGEHQITIVSGQTKGEATISIKSKSK